MPSIDVVDLSRLQFALTALYHFLFVPLTLGLSLLLAIMESVYVMTGRAIWREMTKFWGILFGINFAMGVATGITMEFQFGTNWAYYAHYVGDIFGAPLAIEGLMAFFLEASFVGLFFFGWDRLSRVGHLVVTWLVAIGSNLSALWILIANAWMQNPVGARFNPATMRMEVASFYDVLFNPVAQAKFVHTVSAGYVTGSMFVLSISAFYLLRGRHRSFARRSMTVAASFGLASALSVVVLGDESGYTAGLDQKMKIAAIEAMWETESPPASFTLVGLPDLATHTTRFAIRIPWVHGPYRHALTRHAGCRYRRIGDQCGAAHPRRIGRVQGAGAVACRAQHDRAASDGVVVRRSRLCAAAQAASVRTSKTRPTLRSARRRIAPCPTSRSCSGSSALWSALASTLSCCLRLPFIWRAGAISSDAGFCGSRCGACPCRGSRRSSAGSSPNMAASLGSSMASCRPFSAASNEPVGNVYFSLGGFVLFYSTLAIVEIYLMIKYVRLGPEVPATFAQRRVVAAAGED